MIVVPRRYEKTLRVERENNIRLRSEVGIMKKKLHSAQKDSDDYKVFNCNMENFAKCSMLYFCK